MRAEVAFLTALAEAGVPSDIGELLVHGDPKRGIAPGALVKGLAAATPELVVPYLAELAFDHPTPHVPGGLADLAAKPAKG